MDSGLTGPAILLLEAHKPWAFLGSQLILVVQPALDSFLPRHLLENLALMLSEDDQIEQLIVTLEQKITRRLQS
jgi:hypothetical protein